VTVLLFLLLPALIVTAYALYQWARDRQPSSVESGVDAFRREMQALSPEARPGPRRSDQAPGEPDDEGRGRRPPTPGAR
jgi:hypothetical protein